MANNRNEIVDPDTNHTKQTDCLLGTYCNVPNAISRNLPNPERYKFFHKILKYLTHSTARMTYKKMRCIFKKRRVTPSKPEEEFVADTSLSSIEDDVIKFDAEADAKADATIKPKKMIDAITTTKSDQVSDIKCKKLVGVKHPIHPLPKGDIYRFAEMKYMDNATPKRCHGRIGRIQSDSMRNPDEEFNSEISSDAFAKACEKRRHADFILNEIAKVSDALIEKARCAAVRTETAPFCVPVSMTSRDEMRREIFGSAESLVFPIECVEEESTSVTRLTSKVSRPPTCFDKSVECSKKDFRTALIPVAVQDNKEERAKEEKEELLTKIYLQPEEKPIQVAEHVSQEFMPCKYKKPKYRAKYRIDTSCTRFDTFDTCSKYKVEKIPQARKIYTVKSCDKISTYTFHSSFEAIRRSRFFNYTDKSTTEMRQDDQRSLRILQPIRCCEDLIAYNICHEIPKYCNTWIVPYFTYSQQNEAIRNDTLSHVNCYFLQDLCTTEYHVNCHSLVAPRYCNVNANCAKHRATFENSLCINTHCKSGAKCYPHLNNTDNIRIGYHHCSNSFPVWNNNQRCERDHSYYCTKENLYFMHP